MRNIIIIDADMSQPVELRADPHPAHDDVVVIGGLGRSERGAPLLARLDNRDRERARRKRRRVLVGLDAKRVCLAARDGLDPLQRLLGRYVVGIADLVVGSELRRETALLLGLRGAASDSGTDRDDHECCLVHGGPPWLMPYPGRAMLLRSFAAAQAGESALDGEGVRYLVGRRRTAQS